MLDVHVWSATNPLFLLPLFPSFFLIHSFTIAQFLIHSQFLPKKSFNDLCLKRAKYLLHVCIHIHELVSVCMNACIYVCNRQCLCQGARWVSGTAAVILGFPTSVTPQSSEQPAWKVPAVWSILLLSCWSLLPLTLGTELAETIADTLLGSWGKSAPFNPAQDPSLRLY